MSYQQIIDEMDPGLERCILSILDKRNGVEKAIKKGEIIALTRQLGFKVSDERQIRIAISKLRKNNILIGSLAKVGYFMITNRAEWEEVKNKEFLAKIKDMNDTIHIMDASARSMFGEGYQGRLL